jgi:hypothetical protein
MTRRTFRTAAIVLATLALPAPTGGCAVLLTGYLVGKAISDDKATEACRANLKITNDQRLREGKDLYPDTCSR